MNASHPKIVKLHRDVDGRFKELNFTHDDFPPSSYDRFFLSNGLLVTIDLPFQLPAEAKMENEPDEMPGCVYDRGHRLAFMASPTRRGKWTKWMFEHSTNPDL